MLQYTRPATTDQGNKQITSSSSSSLQTNASFKNTSLIPPSSSFPPLTPSQSLGWGETDSTSDVWSQSDDDHFDYNYWSSNKEDISNCDYVKSTKQETKVFAINENYEPDHKPNYSLQLDFADAQPNRQRFYKADGPNVNLEQPQLARTDMHKLGLYIKLYNSVLAQPEIGRAHV